MVEGSAGMEHRWLLDPINIELNYQQSANAMPMRELQCHVNLYLDPEVCGFCGCRKGQTMMIRKQSIHKKCPPIYK